MSLWERRDCLFIEADRKMIRYGSSRPLDAALSRRRHRAATFSLRPADTNAK